MKPVTAGVHSMALTKIDGDYTAMENCCPHQGGPLGEGSIEVGEDGQCWLRCPWHGWDFDPKTSRPPGGHEDSGQTLFPIEVRDDGVYVDLEPDPVRETTVTGLMAETITNRGVTSVFGMVGRSCTAACPLPVARGIGSPAVLSYGEWPRGGGSRH